MTQFLMYANFIASRGYICNQLGNIALRSNEVLEADQDLVITKHRGISLEEMTDENIVGLGLNSNDLLFGEITPSVGHALNREILINRSDINAVIHVHVDELIAYFSLFYDEQFRYISADAAIIVGSPPVIFPPELNIELDAKQASPAINNTNILILANHGVTVFGESISQAYNRLNTITAEVRRLIWARQLAQQNTTEVNYLDQSEVDEMYELGKKIL